MLQLIPLFLTMLALNSSNASMPSTIRAKNEYSLRKQERLLTHRIKEKEPFDHKQNLFSPFSLFKRERINQPKIKPKLNQDFLEEFLLDTTLNFGPAPGDQDFADVAFDGTNYFVVWYDFRNDDIYGARVTSGGVLLDSLGIPICSTFEWQAYPSVTFDGTNYFVVWEDWRNWDDLDIYGARVSPAGIVLDPDGIPITTAECDQTMPSIEFDGSNYLVAWSDYRNGMDYNIYAARVSPSGVVLDPNGIAVSTAPNEQTIFRGIGFDGTNYLLVWHDDRDGDYYYDVYGARVTQGGVVLEPNGFAISIANNSQGYAQVGFDNTNYLVVWLDDRAMEQDFRIYGARVTPGGSVLEPNGIQISQYYSFHPTLDFDGTNYMVVWTDVRSSWETDIYGARVTTTGAVLDPLGIPISTSESDQVLPAIVFDGTKYFTTWSDYRSANYDIYGARMTTGGTVLDPNGILLDYGYSSPEQYYPAAAFDGTNYLVVWMDSRNGEVNIYGSRVTPQGNVLDPTGIMISNTGGGQFYPLVAFDGSNYLVVWEDGRNLLDLDIYGARVTTAGLVLDPQGIPISTLSNNQWFPSLAFDGTNYLVTWADDRDGDWVFDIYGARVSTAGTVLEPQGFAISTANYDQIYPAIAFDGTNYLVAWTDDRDGDYYYDLYGARVTPNAVVLEPQGFQISNAAGDQANVSLAFDGNNYLAVWLDFRNLQLDIYGARITTSGSILEPQGIPISTAENDQFMPSVAFDGTNYLAVWTDWRNWDDDIYGARVTTAGVVLDPSGIELINQLEPRREAIVTKGPNNQLLLALTGYISLYGTTKILGAFYPGVGIAEKDFGIRNWEFGNQNMNIFPNPVKKDGQIEFILPKASKVELELLDISGRCVKQLSSNQYTAGKHKILIEMQDLAAGVYMLKFKTETKTVIKRFVKVK